MTRLRSGLLFSFCVFFLASCGPTLSPQEEQGLAGWAQNVRTQSAMLVAESASLRKETVNDPTNGGRVPWRRVAESAHRLEGMAGGVKRLEPYLTVIVTGFPPEKEGARPDKPGQALSTVPLPSGAEETFYGNLVHAVLEPMLWRTGEWADGTEPSIFIAAAAELERQALLLRDAAQTWRPTRQDAIDTVDSAFSYVGYRIFQWSEAQKPAGQTSEPNETFPGQGRLEGVRLSLENARDTYRLTFRHALDAELAEMLDRDFQVLLQFVENLASQDERGIVRTEEERNGLIDQAATLAEQGMAHVGEAARQLGVRPPGT